MEYCVNCNKEVKIEDTCYECNKHFCASNCLSLHSEVHNLHRNQDLNNVNLMSFAGCDYLHPLMTKGIFKDKINSPSYDYRNFDYIKVGNKNQMLGSGAFGDVYLATHRLENRKYAIKVLNKEKLSKNNIKSDFIKKEIDVHKKLDHPYIINLKCHHETEEAFYMVMDYAKNGTLYSKIKKMKFGFSEESAFKYFIQTCSAIYFLHKNNLAHRDIKPENLLLDDNNNIKVSDFGWCEYISKKGFNDICGTYEYMAPEIINEKAYNEKVDNWALGILLYELLHGKSPFFVEDLYKDQTKINILFNKINKNQYEIKEELSDYAKDLIKNLLNPNPSERFSLSDVFQHPWVVNRKTNFRSSKRMNTVYLKPHDLNLDKKGIVLEDPKEMLEANESGDLNVKVPKKSDFDAKIQCKLFFSPVKHKSKKLLLENSNNEDSRINNKNKVCDSSSTSNNNSFIPNDKDKCEYNNYLTQNTNNSSKMSSRNNEQQMLFKLFNISDHKEVTLSTTSICLTMQDDLKDNRNNNNFLSGIQVTSDTKPSIIEKVRESNNSLLRYQNIKDTEDDLYAFDNSFLASNRTSDIFKNTSKVVQTKTSSIFTNLASKNQSSKKIFERESTNERMSTNENSTIEFKQPCFDKVKYSPKKKISNLESLKEEPIGENKISPLKQIFNFDTSIDEKRSPNKLHIKSPGLKLSLSKKSVYSSAYRKNDSTGNSENKKTKASEGVHTDSEDERKYNVLLSNTSKLKPKQEITIDNNQSYKVEDKRKVSFFVDNKDKKSAKTIFDLQMDNDESDKDINNDSMLSKAIISPDKLKKRMPSINVLNNSLSSKKENSKHIIKKSSAFCYDLKLMSSIGLCDAATPKFVQK